MSRNSFTELVVLSAPILSTDPLLSSYDRSKAKSVISKFTEMEFLIFRITSHCLEGTRS